MIERGPGMQNLPDYYSAVAALQAWAGKYPTTNLGVYVQEFTVKVLRVYIREDGLRGIYLDLLGGPSQEDPFRTKDTKCTLTVTNDWLLIDRVIMPSSYNCG